MGNEITLSKTTVYLLAGLLLAIVVGGFLVSATGNPPCNGTGNDCTAKVNDSTGLQQNSAPQGQQDTPQDVYLTATGYGYDNPVITVKKGVPVRFHFTAHNAGCGSTVFIDAFGVRLTSSGEDEVAEFTPQQEGTYPYHCGMNMFRGSLVVTS